MTKTLQSSKPDNNEGLAGLLSAVLAHAAAVQADDDALDNKANNLMAAMLVIIPLLGTQLHDGHGHWDFLVVISMGIMTANVLFTLYLTRSQQYQGLVVDLGQHPEYFAKDSSLLLAQLIEDANSAVDINTAILYKKRKHFRAAVIGFLWAFMVGIAVVFFAHGG